jgi:glycosyltransferase involved in cell wall biosynthesis
MKIVHLIDYFQPALGYQELFLAREQQRLGHKVTVVTSDRFAPFPGYATTVQPIIGVRQRGAGRFLERNVPVIRLPVNLEVRSRCWMRGVGATLAELRPDVVHAHNVMKFTTIQAIRAKQRLGFRLIVDDHQHPIDVNGSLMGRLAFGAFRNYVAGRFSDHVDAVVAVTSEIGDVMQSVYGFHPDRIHVIELGVDASLFTFDAAARRELRVRWDCSDGQFLVIYTGKVVPQKGLHWLIEALVRCAEPIRVLIVGNPQADYAQTLTTTAERLGVRHRLVFHPGVPQDELPRFYSACDAACWPRGVSIATLEAAACMLPLVIAAGTVEQRIAAGNGFAYPEGDIGALADALQRLADDPQAARDRGRVGAAMVRSQHSWTAINQQFLDLYAA